MELKGCIGLDAVVSEKVKRSVLQQVSLTPSLIACKLDMVATGMGCMYIVGSHSVGEGYSTLRTSMQFP